MAGPQDAAPSARRSAGHRRLPSNGRRTRKDLTVLARLPDLFGGDASALEASAIFRHDGNMRRFRHEVFKPSMLCRRETVFCSLCLLEDRPQHSRAIWQFTSTVCCDRHGIALTTKPTDVHFDALVPSVAFPNSAALRQLCDAAKPMSRGPLQRYVEDRLDGSAREPLWPDGCRLDQVMGISSCLGNAMRNQAARDLGDACRIGFEALRRGERPEGPRRYSVPTGPKGPRQHPRPRLEQAL
ncbi:TniQ family protein [Paenirhodobacter sp.]|uniref:TniQ family protein n=1 Tax=Paenirhodobacter sp. TaxID=1965326 RepID=UPI003B51475D